MVNGTLTNSSMQTAFYGVDWTAACTNPAFLQRFDLCVYQEYWVGNLSTGAVTGPVFVQTPATYEGPNVPAGRAPSLLGLSLAMFATVVAVGAAAGVVALVATRRSRHGRATRDWELALTALDEPVPPLEGLHEQKSNPGTTGDDSRRDEAQDSRGAARRLQ